MSALGRAADLLGAADELRYRCTLVSEAGESLRLEFHVVRVSMAGLAPGDGYEALPWCMSASSCPRNPSRPSPSQRSRPNSPRRGPRYPPRPLRPLQPRRLLASEPAPQSAIQPWSFDDDDEVPPGWSLRWQGAPS